MALCGVNITLWVVAVAHRAEGGCLRDFLLYQQSNILFCELYLTERLMS